MRARLAAQSPQITASLSRVRALRAELLATADAARQTRTQAAALVPAVTDGLRAVRAVSAVQTNIRALRETVASLQQVLRAPDDVNLLLQTGEYAAAIHAVHAAKDALAHRHLAPVVALAPARGRLAQAVEAIDTALRDEFRNALRAGRGQDDTLREVVSLVALMGRLPLLRGFFLKEIKIELGKELKAVDSLHVACRELKASAEQALTLINIIATHRKTADAETEDISGLLREVHGDLEDMLASVVDRVLGPFYVSQKTGARGGFLVITPMESLTEQTCFDEFKAALKFGEEIRSLEQAANELEQMFSLEKKSSLLRAKISERHFAFLSSFHKAHVGTLTETVKEDRWQEIRTPDGARRLLSAVLDEESEKDGTLPHPSGNGIQPTPNGAVQDLTLDERNGSVVIGAGSFKTVASGIRYLRSVCAYTLLAEKSPRLAPEIARRATELARLFNSLVGKAILGAAALQWSGLRSITARHLSLASRTVAMAAALADRIDKPLARALSSSQAGVVLPMIQKSEKDLRDHHGQLLAKILTIMMDRLDAHEIVLRSLPWGKYAEMRRFDMPSAYIATLVKEATVLHRILWSVLPKTEVSDIFTRVCAAYGNHLTESYSSLDGGKEWVRSRVAEDVTCLHDRLLSLDVFKAKPEAFEPVRKLYVRFAKELHESASKNERDSSTGRVFIRSQKEQLIRPQQEVASTGVAKSRDSPNKQRNSDIATDTGKSQDAPEPSDSTKSDWKSEDPEQSNFKKIDDKSEYAPAQSNSIEGPEKSEEVLQEADETRIQNGPAPGEMTKDATIVKEDEESRNEGNISIEAGSQLNPVAGQGQNAATDMRGSMESGNRAETQPLSTLNTRNEISLKRLAGPSPEGLRENPIQMPESQGKSGNRSVSVQSQELSDMLGLSEGEASKVRKMKSNEELEVAEKIFCDSNTVSNERRAQQPRSQIPEGDLLGLEADLPNTTAR